jgi:hypothetical protein
VWVACEKLIEMWCVHDDIVVEGDEHLVVWYRPVTSCLESKNSLKVEMVNGGIWVVRHRMVLRFRRMEIL